MQRPSLAPPNAAQRRFARWRLLLGAGRPAVVLAVLGLLIAIGVFRT